MHLRDMVIASGNKGKFVEFRDLLSPLGIELHFGKDMSDLDVEETGSTFLENATLKARAWASHAKMAALADDSGIEVEALDGRPGIYSARMGCDERSCRDWLLNELQGIENRKARYTAALVLALPDGGLWSTEEYCYGTVAVEPRGENGFGYDPIFIPEGYDMTFGELEGSIKSSISHRAKASRNFIKWLADGGNMVK
nr:RdgB/HAM1 family non-canonical purine NTP pyrophosphatase [uncultured Dethiosulfovibrio sp.]